MKLSKLPEPWQALVISAALAPVFRTAFDSIIWLAIGPHIMKWGYYLFGSIIVALLFNGIGIFLTKKKLVRSLIAGIVLGAFMGSMAILGSRAMMGTPFMSRYAPIIILIWFLTGFCSVYIAQEIQGRLKR